MNKENLKYTTKLEVLLLLKNNNFPQAVALVMLELNCNMFLAKEIVEELKKELL